MKKSTETDLVRGCLALLKLYRVMAWRNNTGAVRSTYNGKTRFTRYGMAGSPDIIAIRPHNGKFIGIECKVGKNKMTDTQEAFAKQVRESGGEYHEIREVRQLENIVKLWAALK